MNKIPKNYLPTLNLRETQEAQIFIKTELVNLIINELEILIVREPKTLIGKMTASGFLNNEERVINFDSSNDNKIYTLFSEYKYWLVNTIKEMEINNNNGIAVFTNSINRDKEITNVESFEQNLLQIEYRYDNLENTYEKGKELMGVIVKIIKIIEKKIMSKYNTNRSFPKKLYFKEIDKFGNKKYLESSVATIAAEKGTFILSNNRKSKSEKSILNNFEILLIAYSKSIDKGYTLINIQDRKTLLELEPIISESEITMEEFIFRKDILNNEDVKTINISINLDTLSMHLLDKSHIFELQSSVSIDEIEKILLSSGIKHL